MYNRNSLHAEDFISHQEILDTIEHAQIHAQNLTYVDEILAKARKGKGLDHREASVLLACTDDARTQEIFAIARKIKQDYYGNRIVLFAPLYLSNYCVNGCTYCPYHRQNKTMPRVKLTQEEIAAEVIALQDMGHKRLAIELGEDPINNPIEYVLESLNTIYSVKHKNGAIRRANVNIAATTEENYAKLREAEIGTYILFQETYNAQAYKELHPTGPKHNYKWHTEAHDRAMRAGIDDVGLGVLFGLDNYAYEFAGLLMHAEHLEAVFGVGPHTISVPRIRPAEGIDVDSFSNALDDATFEKLVACIRIAVPYTGMIVSTRESQACRERLLDLGVSQISGASKTTVGGYHQEAQVNLSCNTSDSSPAASLADETQQASEGALLATSSAATSASNASNPENDSAQFEVNDNRTLDEVIAWLITLGYLPSFCTACYRAGRQGDRFMELCKNEQIADFCHPNALMTLKEYLLDYASEETCNLGNALIEQELSKPEVANTKTFNALIKNLEEITKGKRDFRF